MEQTASSSSTPSSPGRTWQAALAHDPSLLARVESLVAALSADQAAVVTDVIQALSSSNKRGAVPEDDSAPGTPAAKRARTTTPVDAPTDPLVRIPDVSVSAPVRRKLTVVLDAARVYLVGADGAVVHHVAHADLGKAVVVSVPEKTKKQSMVLLFGKPEATGTAHAAAFGALEPAVVALTVPEAALAQVPGGSESFAAAFERITGVPVATPADFTSTKKSAMGKRAGHAYVECYLRGKDGFLWLLPDGLVFGLKKPFLWIPHARVHALAVVANGRSKVDLQVTAHVEAGEGGDADGKRVVSFDMIDVEDAGPIEAYIRAHRASIIQSTAAAEEPAAAARPVVVVGRGAAALLAAGDLGDSEDDDPSYSSDEDDRMDVIPTTTTAAAEDDDDVNEGGESDSDSDSGSGTDDEDAATMVPEDADLIAAMRNEVAALGGDGDGGESPEIGRRTRSARRAAMSS
ncbi:hypothetical protein H9P43_001706 [Blastocladiella emersonii ATCC 22665]|nr:hypothetical protein H9P43_001706 [Blastocladiella emersonii ATCC 22665]